MALTPALYLGETWHTPKTPDLVGSGAQDLAADKYGALLVGNDGRIADFGPKDVLLAKHSGVHVVDCSDKIIAPGFVDAHLHFPQLDMIGAHGEQLLRWLKEYTYPAELKFADAAYAAAAAERFLDELFANGTTTFAAYAAVFEASAEALFQAAEKRGARAIIGKVSMDRDAPAGLLQIAAEDLAANERLIAKWHGLDGRLYCALTPRFALACSDELLAGLGKLAAKHPTVYIQTHHAENAAEVAAVRQRFASDPDYLGVYERFGLVGERTILGHCVHASDAELNRIAAQRASIAHCPTSNAFLGSGILNLPQVLAAKARLALGTDVGAGTCFSLWKVQLSAYQLQQLAGGAPSPAWLFHRATLGGAEALGFSDETGSFAVGKAADFQIIDWRRSRLLRERPAESAVQRLFALITCGDDRLTEAVYVRGKQVWARENC